MDQALANELFPRLACILLLDFPPGYDVGIDMYSWIAGEKFKGIKLIPPGIHFVYFSARDKVTGQFGARSGFFHSFKPKEILIKQFDPAQECFKPDDQLDQDQAERYRLAIQEFDRNMGVFPFEQTFAPWSKLTSHVQWSTLDAVLPKNAKGHLHPTAAPSAAPAALPEAPAAQALGSAPSPSDAPRPKFASLDGTRQILRSPQRLDLLPTNRTPFRFSSIPRYMHPENATPQEITFHSMDTSYLLKHVLLQRHGKDPTTALGEVEVAFILFLIGQQYEGFEAWRDWLRILCNAGTAIVSGEHQDLFMSLFDVLRQELVFIEADLFESEGAQSNFLRSYLKSLVSFALRSPKMAHLALQLSDTVAQRFKWSLVPAQTSKIAELPDGATAAPDDDDDEDDPEYQPTVVEM